MGTVRGLCSSVTGETKHSLELNSGAEELWMEQRGKRALNELFCTSSSSSTDSCTSALFHACTPTLAKRTTFPCLPWVQSRGHRHTAWRRGPVLASVITSLLTFSFWRISWVDLFLHAAMVMSGSCLSSGVSTVLLCRLTFECLGNSSSSKLLNSGSLESKRKHFRFPASLM